MMNKTLFFVIFSLSFTSLFSQNCNDNVYSQDEVLRLSIYAKNLEKKILDKNPSDTNLIAKLVGDYSKDCSYSDLSVIKISNYLKELEKRDSINNIVVLEEVKEDIVKEDEIVKEDKIEVQNNPVVSVTKDLIYFDVNSYKIKSVELDEILGILKADSKKTVLLDGYADDTASDEFNLNLSKQRNNSVKNFLISKGISASRIKTIPHGESDPVAPNDTEEGRLKNRRVQITVQ